MVNQSHFPLVLQCHAAASESGKQRHHQWSTGRSFKPGDVAIDPLARRRDRLTATGRRCSDIAKKEIRIRRAALAAPADKNKFRNRRARESAGARSEDVE